MSLEGVGDTELVARMKHGDRTALAVLFDRHRDFVFRTAMSLTGRREDSVEIVQDVFLALLERPPSLKADGARLTTWLFQVTRNRSIDRVRSVARTGTMNAVSDRAHLDSPEEATLRAERIRLLADAVRELPARMRDAFLLRIILELDTDDAARALNCRLGAVRTALHEALVRLRAVLSDEGKSDGGSDDAKLIER